MKSKSNNRIFLIVALSLAVFFAGKYFYMKPSISEAEKAMDFTATLANGSEFNLSDLQGKYVLLDFWGSWCGPCIAEMPDLKALYHKYQNATFQKAGGFTIVSVAVQRKEDRWRRALERYAMPWPYQIFDQSESLKFFDSPIADLYGVKQLPTKFLIDPDGLIMGVDLSPGEIDRILEERLEQ